jgi:hypothetical protein
MDTTSRVHDGTAGRPHIAGAETGEESMSKTAATGVGRHIAPAPARPRSRRPDAAGTQRVGLSSRQKLRTAFADMQWELYDLWTVGETVIVRLALQGTHTGHPSASRPGRTVLGPARTSAPVRRGPCRLRQRYRRTALARRDHAGRVAQHAHHRSKRDRCVGD